MKSECFICCVARSSSGSSELGGGGSGGGSLITECPIYITQQETQTGTAQEETKLLCVYQNWWQIGSDQVLDRNIQTLSFSKICSKDQRSTVCGWCLLLRLKLCIRQKKYSQLRLKIKPHIEMILHVVFFLSPCVECLTVSLATFSINGQ